MEPTYNEIEYIPDMNHFAASSTGYTLPPSIYEISDISLTLNSLLPDDIKVDNTIDDIGPKSNLTTNKTKKFTKKPFFYSIVGFSQSHP